MRQILVYGDSNTYGEAAFHKHRLTYEDRWTSKLQRLFDTDKLEVKVIAEGLSGRIAGNYKQHDVHTNGLTHFEPIYRSHAPLDVLVIALATNDIQPKYAQTAKMIFENLLHYQKIVQKVAVDSPIMVLPQVLYLVPPSVVSRDDYFVGNVSLIHELLHMLEKTEELFVTTEDVLLSEDGVHLSPDGHTQIADKVYKKVKGLL